MCKWEKGRGESLETNFLQQYITFDWNWMTIAVSSATEAVAIMARKIQARTGIPTLTSKIPVQCSTSWVRLYVGRL